MARRVGLPFATVKETKPPSTTSEIHLLNLYKEHMTTTGAYYYSRKRISDILYVVFNTA